jgi:predicted nucleic acid-binding protein
MKAVFVDTAGWMALAYAADPLHAQSRAARDSVLEAGQPLVTTDFVADETLTLIRLRLGLAAAEAWWAQVEGSPRLRWERVDSDRFEKARALFFRYRDKDFSFTDCTSFAIMRELRLAHAITTDRHFRQMGFQVLPDVRLPPPRRSRPSSATSAKRGR